MSEGVSFIRVLDPVIWNGIVLLIILYALI